MSSLFEPLLNLLKCGCGRDRQADGSETAMNLSATVVKSVPGPRLGGIDLVSEELPTAKNCFRLVILGSARVGKTSIIGRFLAQKFRDSYTPTIEDFHRKLYRIKGDVYQLDILDTSGNHPFPAMRRLSFLTGDMFLIVFSFESRQSYEEAIRLREQILETKMNAFCMNSSSNALKRKNALKVPMILVGNKSDRENKVVNSSEAKAYCDTQDSSCIFVETSAKKNINIDGLFYELFNVANLPLEMAPNCNTAKRSLGHSAADINANMTNGATNDSSIANTAEALLANEDFPDGSAAPVSNASSSSMNYSRKGNFLTKQSNYSDVCTVVTTNVCRPSLRTDLMIMQSKTSHMSKDNKKTLNLSFKPIQRSSHCSIQ